MPIERAPFHSILFEHPRPDSGIDELREPAAFGDLHLDQVLEAMTAGRRNYRLEPFFYARLHDEAAVAYRHAIMRDLEDPDVFAAIARFADGMSTVRKQLAQAAKLRHRFQQQSWFLAAVETYCRTVRAFAQELSERDLGSRGLTAARDYLADHVAREQFVSLSDEATEFEDAFAGVRYTLDINGGRVTVTGYEGDGDYGAQVEETFAKFRQGAPRRHVSTPADGVEMSRVEERIAEGVAQLYPDLFKARADFCARRRDFQEPTIVQFDREVQFYLAYLDMIRPLVAAGLPFCHPEVSSQSKSVAAVDSFDIALANTLVSEQGTVVCNGFHLDEPERMFVVTGPNNGGKTTFARMFGQLHHLAGLGLPVPGRRARLFLADRIYTHFQREEDIETLRGRFDDELVRFREILTRATEDSIVVMNESFSSTSLDDALAVGREVLRRVLALGALGVYVTFVDELASLSEATVSMVGQVAAANPAQRTFKLIRMPADGRAHAWAIAEQYGLTYDLLMERIGA